MTTYLPRIFSAFMVMSLAACASVADWETSKLAPEPLLAVSFGRIRFELPSGWLVANIDDSFQVKSKWKDHLDLLTMRPPKKSGDTPYTPNEILNAYIAMQMEGREDDAEKTIVLPFTSFAVECVGP